MSRFEQLVLQGLYLILYRMIGRDTATHGAGRTMQEGHWLSSIEVLRRDF